MSHNIKCRSMHWTLNLTLFLTLTLTVSSSLPNADDFHFPVKEGIILKNGWIPVSQTNWRKVRIKSKNSIHHWQRHQKTFYIGTNRATMHRWKDFQVSPEMKNRLPKSTFAAALYLATISTQIRNTVTTKLLTSNWYEQLVRMYSVQLVRSVAYLAFQTMGGNNPLLSPPVAPPFHSL